MVTGILVALIFPRAVMPVLEVITAVILFVLLAFLNVEKTIDQEQAEIKARNENRI